ncbi:MAG: (2Fe-2S) ferredoxin domain-containing protein [Alphaproteobacteria bacterium]|nr:(2Fe-2S) ferredoxin domain-containing protein [Alphaproteobacteria bacterium]
MSEAANDRTDGSGGGYDRLRLCVNFRAGDILPSCGARGAKELAAALQEKMPDALPEMRLESVHCLGRCHIGPTIRLSPSGPFLQGVQAEDVDFLIEKLKAGDLDALLEAFPDPTKEQAG